MRPQSVSALQYVCINLWRAASQAEEIEKEARGSAVMRGGRRVRCPATRSETDAPLNGHAASVISTFILLFLGVMFGSGISVCLESPAAH